MGAGQLEVSLTRLSLDQADGAVDLSLGGSGLHAVLCPRWVYSHFRQWMVVETFGLHAQYLPFTSTLVTDHFSLIFLNAEDLPLRREGSGVRATPILHPLLPSRLVLLVTLQQSGLDLLLEPPLSLAGSAGEGHIMLQLSGLLLQSGTDSVVHVGFEMRAVTVLTEHPSADGGDGDGRVLVYLEDVAIRIAVPAIHTQLLSFITGHQESDIDCA